MSFYVYREDACRTALVSYNVYEIFMRGERNCLAACFTQRHLPPISFNDYSNVFELAIVMNVRDLKLS